MSLCSWSQLALDDFLGFAVSAQIIPYVYFYHYHPLISVLLSFFGTYFHLLGFHQHITFQPLVSSTIPLAAQPHGQLAP